jgi:hypothetical protein
MLCVAVTRPSQRLIGNVQPRPQPALITWLPGWMLRLYWGEGDSAFHHRWNMETACNYSNALTNSTGT